MSALDAHATGRASRSAKRNCLDQSMWRIQTWASVIVNPQTD